MKVPFRWPSDWTSPGLLRLLSGSPIDCVIFDRQDHPVLLAARSSGFTAFVSAADPDRVVTLADAVWPRVKMSQRGERDRASAGPTGAPWVDSNVWRAKLARVRSGGKQVWLAFEAPKGEIAPNDAAYGVAVADSIAGGARWIVTLDPEWSRALAAGKAEALGRWQKLLATLAYFETRDAWRAYEPAGPLGILSDFAGDNEFMGGEVLNLAQRANMFFRIVEQTGATSADFEDYKALVYVNHALPKDALRGKIAAFVRAGGLLIAPAPVAALFPKGRELNCDVPGYSLHSLGQGRVASPTKEWDDPYQVANDARNLMSRRYDPARLYNSGATGVHYSVARDGRTELLQLVNFTGRSSSTPLTVGVARAYRSALLHVLENAGPQALQPIQREHGVEYQLPPFSTYAAIELKG